MKSLILTMVTAIPAPLMAFSDAHETALPPLVMQPNAERVTFEHIDAVNAYITRDGLLSPRVTIFDPSAMDIAE